MAFGIFSTGLLEMVPLVLNFEIPPIYQYFVGPALSPNISILEIGLFKKVA